MVVVVVVVLFEAAQSAQRQGSVQQGLSAREPQCQRAVEPRQRGVGPAEVEPYHPLIRDRGGIVRIGIQQLGNKAVCMDRIKPANLLCLVKQHFEMRKIDRHSSDSKRR